MKKKRFKTQLLAFLTAVFVLVPILAFSVFAYPGQSYIPPTGSYSLTDKSASEQFLHVAEHNLVGQSVGDDWEYTMIPQSLQFDGLVDWSYFSFQLSIADENNNEFGHYTIGAYLDKARGDVMWRIGWLYTINGVTYSEFPFVEESEGVYSTLLGYRIVRLTDGRSVLDMQLLSYDPSTNQVIQSGYVSAEIPTEAKKAFLQVKLNYASSYGKFINNTVDVPHMPVDIWEVGGAYEDGYHDAAVDSSNTFDNMGRLIWTVIDMPFVLIQQVLNFDIFGFNVANLVFGLLTICLCIFILGKVGVF